MGHKMQRRHWWENKMRWCEWSTGGGTGASSSPELAWGFTWFSSPFHR